MCNFEILFDENAVDVDESVRNRLETCVRGTCQEIIWRGSREFLERITFTLLGIREVEFEFKVNMTFSDP